MSEGIDSEAIVCLDTGVVVKALVPEDPPELSAAARRLLIRAIVRDRLVAPAFAWAEVGSVLRKKIRQRAISLDEAAIIWDRFTKLDIEFLDTATLRVRAWELAEHYTLPTLYDAAFLACTETALSSDGTRREFWTTDETLLLALAVERPSYVNALSAG